MLKVYPCYCLIRLVALCDLLIPLWDQLNDTAAHLLLAAAWYMQIYAFVLNTC